MPHSPSLMSARTALLLTFRSLPSWKHRVPAYLSGPTLWCYFCSFLYSGFLDTLFCGISADQSDIASCKCDSSWKEPQQVLVSGQEEITYGCVVIVIFLSKSLLFLVSQTGDVIRSCYVAVSFLLFVLQRKRSSAFGCKICAKMQRGTAYQMAPSGFSTQYKCS